MCSGRLLAQDEQFAVQPLSPWIVCQYIFYRLPELPTRNVC